MHRPIHTAFVVSLLSVCASAQSSALWGHSGEAWDPYGRLPDFSRAGYAAGEKPLPVVPVVTDVLAHGARGDGFTNDVQAFRNALAYAAGQGGGAVYVPAGTYVIGDFLDINMDNVVLRGAGSGPGGTTLYFPNNLRTLTGKQHPWKNGEGGIVWVGHRSALAPGLGSFVTNVVQQQVRGDDRLVVANGSAITPGEFILLRLTDPGDGSLGRHLHNEQANPGNCSWQPLPFHWPVQVVAVNGNELVLAQPLRFDVRGAWTPKIHRYLPVREVGIEHLALACKPHVYPGHLIEDGYNPLTFTGALNCWMKDVAIRDADNGPSFNNMTKHCTAQGIWVLGGFAGHHAFSILEAVADCLLEDFYIEPVYIHGITVDHFPSGNVIRRGGGSDMNLDHHRDGAFENLFTDLDVGAGSSIWASGGSTCAGPNAGARNTYWNLRGPWGVAPDPLWIDIQSNLIPAQTTYTTTNNAWMEALPNVTPRDLYASQLEQRLDRQILGRAAHTVANFDDGTIEPLGQEQGSPPVIVGSSLLVADTELARFVDPTYVWDDQEIVFQIPPGMPRAAQIGVALRAPSTSDDPYSVTRLFLEGHGGLGEIAGYVIVRLQGPNGLAVSSSGLFVDPTSSLLTVRVLVAGNRLRAYVNNVLAVDSTGIPTPPGGGYTSFWADRDASVPGGMLGFLQAKVHAPGENAEIHIDARGTTWITLHQQNLFAGAFDPSGFQFFIGDQIQLNYWQFLALVFPSGRVRGVEPVSLHHLTLGVRLPLPPGTRVAVGYGGIDQTVVPWW